VLVSGFGQWLPSHIAMRFREIQGLDHTESLENLIENGHLVTAKSYDEFLEIFGMVEMIIKCQDLLVDRGGMARFFIAAGQALYTSRQGAECSVEYGQEFPVSISTQAEFETITSGDSGMYVYCGVRRRDHGAQHDSSRAVPEGDPEFLGDNYASNGHIHTCPQNVRSLVERETQTDDTCVPMEVHSHKPLSDDHQQHHGDSTIHQHHSHITRTDIHSYMECEVQTDLDIGGAAHIIRSIDPVFKLYLLVRVDIQHISPVMDVVSMELELRPEVVLNPDDSFNLTCTVGNPMQDLLFAIF
jgi:hypothetical protein